MGNGGLGFWPRAAPPPARGGPCSCSVPPAARAARAPGARPAAPPSRFGAIAPSALFGPMDGAKRKRNAGGIAIVRLAPAQVVSIKGPGLRGTAGRPPCGLKPSPRGGGVVFGGFRPPRGWRPALGPLRPVPGSGQYWAGPPSRPPPGWAPPSAMGAFRGGGKPRFSPSPRGRKGGRARRPAPLGSKCGPGRGGLDSAACGRRGTAGGINAPGWWIANERHP